MVVLDGVYTWEHGRPRFHHVAAPTRQRLEQVLDRLIRRLLRRLTCDGWLVLDSEQPWLDLEPADAIDNLAAASIRYRIALGPEAGRRTLTLKNPGLTRSDTVPKALTADQNGFSLNAAVACQPHERHRLEYLCRYITPVRGRVPPSASSGFPPIVPVRSSNDSSNPSETAPPTSCSALKTSSPD
jgi:hypothetical protein